MSPTQRLRVVLRLRLQEHPNERSGLFFARLINVFRAAKRVDPDATLRIEHIDPDPPLEP
jgi:hypothetical protein